MIKERPILMQGWGVRAILDDRKSQTRRVMKHQPVGAFIELTSDLGYPASRGNIWAGFGDPKDPIYHTIYHKCPYGQPGDLLWIRETFRFYDHEDDHEYGMPPVEYRADTDSYHPGIHWKPSIFMPKWAARIWRRITDIRAERVQDISDSDCDAEGLYREWDGKRFWYGLSADDNQLTAYPRTKFIIIWDSINIKPKLSCRNPWTRALEDCYVSYPWEDIQVARQHHGKRWYVIGNPWVWAITSEKADR